MNLDNESDKTEDDNTDEKIHAINELSEDINSRKNSYNTNQTINDLPTNPSVDSSTDTLIPNNSEPVESAERVDEIKDT